MKQRPVIAKVGADIEAVSKWLDVQLQHLMKQLPWCMKDSESFRHEVIQVLVPPNACIMTFDVISMYSNINLDHAIEVAHLWIELHVPPTEET